MLSWTLNVVIFSYLFFFFFFFFFFNLDQDGSIEQYERKTNSIIQRIYRVIFLVGRLGDINRLENELTKLESVNSIYKKFQNTVNTEMKDK